MYNNIVKMWSPFISFSYLTLYNVTEFNPIILGYEEPYSLQIKSPSHPSSQIAFQSTLQEPILLLTREDLQEAGYDQVRKPWTPEEDQILKECRKKDMEWQEIAQLVPGRSPQMCNSRFKRMQRPKIVWRKKDDDKLMLLVSQFGQDWKQIAKHFKHWNERQVRQHYNYHLRPNLDGQAWTIEEDLNLIRFVNKHGKNWALSSRYFPTKSIAHVKSRFYGRLSRLNDKKILELEKENPTSKNNK